MACCRAMNSGSLHRLSLAAIALYTMGSRISRRCPCIKRCQRCILLLLLHCTVETSGSLQAENSFPGMIVHIFGSRVSPRQVRVLGFLGFAACLHVDFVRYHTET